jgi:ArsR family transcriptional regulator
MDLESSVATLSALAQPTRLEVFRLLVRNEPNGLPAGKIAKLLGVPHNTMSTHLNILNRTGLVSSERDGRSIVYRVELSVVRDFFVYLLTDCCDGRPELCQPLMDDLTFCCQPTGAACARQNLQCPVSLHGQFRPLYSRRSHSATRRARQIQSL